MRLTRRGRVALVATGAVLVGAAVAVPLLKPNGGRPAPETGTPTRTLVVPEGWRASQVYDAVDRTLGLPPGSTRVALDKAHLQLPSEAAGNPEGYLFPATYPVAKGATPESVLRQMVDTANDEFHKAPVAAGAQLNALNVYQTVTIASIVQAEAATKADMGKVARVVFNRLQRGMPLQMDSTLNYALNRTAVHTSIDDVRMDNPYNSYQRLGLPPTPIGNPGEDAIRAVTSPPAGDWLYFVTIDPGETRFTADYTEHLRNVAEFNARHQPSTQPPLPSGSPSPQRSAVTRPAATPPAH
ncbi:aminodeoxychorismate lyase [Streptomyces bungoensis]|uniref:Endolytic murein transglycosylase n=1 Tax=Streptomyces bungoensis TaxID=285568 RepID=A0A101TAS7_9ACTN|nr:aminodeoxychorismate lyase [Streptomyces bungoensis]